MSDSKWITGLSPVLVVSLQKAGITEPAKLVQKLQSKAEVLSLSQMTGVIPIKLVSLAAREEMARVLGNQNVSLENLQLLECAGLGTPTELGKFAGNEVSCAGYLGYIAQSLGMAPPTPQQVTAWVQLAAHEKSILPDLRTLLPEVGKGNPLPFRPLAIGESFSSEDFYMSQVAVESPEGSEGLKTQKQFSTGERGQRHISGSMETTAVLQTALLTNVIVIKPGESEICQEFIATLPGLYRADISLQRKSGFVTMSWAIDKPTTKLAMVELVKAQASFSQAADESSKIGAFVGTMTAQISKEIAETKVYAPLNADDQTKAHLITLEKRGIRRFNDAPEYAPIRQGNDKGTGTGRWAGQGDYYLYFWLKPSDIPSNGKLRLRLLIEKNEDAPTPEPKKVGDPDYYVGKFVPPPEKPDPTITGTIVITRQPPTSINYGKPSIVPDSKPVQWFRAEPYYTAPGGEGERAYKLEVTAQTDPNFYQDYLPDYVLTEYQKAQGLTGHGVIEGIQIVPSIIHNETIPIDGPRYHNSGRNWLTIQGSIQDGTYDVVIGANADTLMKEGCLIAGGIIINMITK